MRLYALSAHQNEHRRDHHVGFVLDQIGSSKRQLDFEWEGALNGCGVAQAITARNLDEFFAKRVGGLKRQQAAGV